MRGHVVCVFAGGFVSVRSDTVRTVFGFGTAFANWTSTEAGKPVWTPENGWVELPRALRAGMTHFDSAYSYGSHKILGAVLGMEVRCALHSVERGM